MSATIQKNVYELVQERLRVIFQDFDNIYISFSGGKDSGVLLNLCIDYIRKHNLNVRIGVFHIDYEIQYSMTVDYINRTFKENRDIIDVYRVCVPFRVTTCTSMYQNYWRPWDEKVKNTWVRPLPDDTCKEGSETYLLPGRYPYPGKLQPLAYDLQECEGSV